MTVLTRFLAVVVLVLALIAPAQAFGWHLVRSTTYSSGSYYSSWSYYCAQPVGAQPVYRYYYSAVTPVYTVPAAVYAPSVDVVPSLQPLVDPFRTAPAYAQPTPAPPSGIRPVPTTGRLGGPRVTEETQEPPLPVNNSTRPSKASGPRVTESRSFYDPYTQLTNTTTISESSLVRVGFWNTRGQTVTLSIDGRTHTVAGGHAITLNLPRQFSWRMDEGSTQGETVPAERTSLEIVIR
jgi:hypothetical protein